MGGVSHASPLPQGHKRESGPIRAESIARFRKAHMHCFSSMQLDRYNGTLAKTFARKAAQIRKSHLAYWHVTEISLE